MVRLPEAKLIHHKGDIRCCDPQDGVELIFDPPYDPNINIYQDARFQIDQESEKKN